MTLQYRALAPITAGEGLHYDLQSVFSAMDLAKSAGGVVDLDAIYASEPFEVEFRDSDETVATSELDHDAALGLVDIDLERFELPETLLNIREAGLRNLMRIEAPELSEAREGMANVLQGLGGVAVYRGDLLGVSSAARIFMDLRTHPN